MFRSRIIYIYMDLGFSLYPKSMKDIKYLPVHYYIVRTNIKFYPLPLFHEKN